MKNKILITILIIITILIVTKDFVYVVRVVDGDTFEVTRGMSVQRVRLLLIDAPESVSPDESKNCEDGVKSSKYLKELIEGKFIRLERDIEDKDKYGRLLRYGFLLSGEMLQINLVKNEYAVIKVYEPNIKYLKKITEQTK